MSQLDEQLAPIGGLQAFTFHAGQVMHNPTAATFVVTPERLSYISPQWLVREDLLELLTLGALETVRAEARRDPRVRFQWVS